MSERESINAGPCPECGATDIGLTVLGRWRCRPCGWYGEPPNAEERCICGDSICTLYDKHGWRCDECADALGDDLYTDEEREAIDDAA